MSGAIVTAMRVGLQGIELTRTCFRLAYHRESDREQSDRRSYIGLPRRYDRGRSVHTVSRPPADERMAEAGMPGWFCGRPLVGLGHRPLCHPSGTRRPSRTATDWIASARFFTCPHAAMDVLCRKSRDQQRLPWKGPRGRCSDRRRRRPLNGCRDLLAIHQTH